uniref:Oxysterol-binding protein n=1 Tax=Ditylenchus dipsaci TaxID=166011 RepID=A0A915E5W2_9BILA
MSGTCGLHHSSIMSKNSITNAVEGSIEVRNVMLQLPPFISRETLPARMLSKDQTSVWSIIKNAIGKDLTRLTVPINFNEPISLIQRLAENMENSYLITKALECKDQCERLELVGAFAASTMSNLRISKPFNPILFETYELHRPDLGFKFVAEQVGHHPPVSTLHCSGDGFEFYGTVAPKMKFFGRSITVDPRAHFTLKLAGLNETYTWQALDCAIHNVVFGQLFMALTGTLTVKQYADGTETGICFSLDYKNSGQNGGLVTGDISVGKNKLRSIYGDQSTYLASCSPTLFSQHCSTYETFFRQIDNAQGVSLVLFKDSRLLWQRFEKPVNSQEYYDFTYFAMITDSRLRPDMREMENGEFEKASQEKHRLEDKQRDARALDKKTKKAKLSKWFNPMLKRDEFGRENQWISNGNYWKRQFDDCEDIF